MRESAGSLGGASRPILRLSSVRKEYGNLVVLEDVSFDIDEGKFLCIVGPSGSGKSTLLSCIAGLEAPTRGAVWLGEKQVTAPTNECGMVFQDYALFPWMTVEANVGFGLRMQTSLSSAERRERVREYLELVGLQSFGDYFPHQLSGGMRQRVALARSLVVKPKVLLMDEPFAAVDALTRRSLQVELSRIWALTKMTIVLVTHSLTEAVFLGDEVLCITRSPARIKSRTVIDEPRPRDVENPGPALAGHLVTVQRSLYAEVDELRALTK